MPISEVWDIANKNRRASKLVIHLVLNGIKFSNGIHILI